MGADTAYLPLEGVYVFHESAERWKLRRYHPAVAPAEGAERVRTTWSEAFVDVFPDRRWKGDRQETDGQQTVQTCRIYLRTPILPTDDDLDQPSDVLFDPKGRAWSAPRVGDWPEAGGLEVVLRRQGTLGSRPFA